MTIPRPENLTIGATIANIEEKGLPLGDAHYTLSVSEKAFVSPLQKKLFRHRWELFFAFMYGPIGNLLTSNESKLRRLAIWQSSSGGLRYFTWTGRVAAAGEAAAAECDEIIINQSGAVMGVNLTTTEASVMMAGCTECDPGAQDPTGVCSKFA